MTVVREWKLIRRRVTMTLVIFVVAVVVPAIILATGCMISAGTCS
jgi:hypothetical protein